MSEFITVFDIEVPILASEHAVMDKGIVEKTIVIDLKIKNTYYFDFVGYY